MAKTDAAPSGNQASQTYGNIISTTTRLWHILMHFGDILYHFYSNEIYCDRRERVKAVLDQGVIQTKIQGTT